METQRTPSDRPQVWAKLRGVAEAAGILLAVAAGLLVLYFLVLFIGVVFGWWGGA